jgi:hypothetical protein
VVAGVAGQNPVLDARRVRQLAQESQRLGEVRAHIYEAILLMFFVFTVIIYSPSIVSSIPDSAYRRSRPPPPSSAATAPASSPWTRSPRCPQTTPPAPAHAGAFPCPPLPLPLPPPATDTDLDLVQPPAPTAAWSPAPSLRPPPAPGRAAVPGTARCPRPRTPCTCTRGDSRVDSYLKKQNASTSTITSTSTSCLVMEAPTRLSRHQRRPLQPMPRPPASRCRARRSCSSSSRHAPPQ